MKRIASISLFTLLLCSLAGLGLASGDAHHVDSGVLVKDFLYRCFNFAVAFGLLAYFVTKPIRKGMAGRREGIEKALADAKQAQQAAETKFAEYDAKLNKASLEIDEIRVSIKREAEMERDRVIASAKAMAAKIEQDAEKSANRVVVEAKASLRREAATMAVAIAEEILNKNFSSEDHSRLVDEYLQKVGELH